MTRGLRWAALWCAAACVPGAVAGQTVIDAVTDLDLERPEAWAMAYYTSVGLFHSFGAPRLVEPGEITFGLEGGLIPQLSDDERRVGFSGTKLEDSNKSRTFARLRLAVGLPYSVTAEVGFVPPLERNGAEAALFSGALGIPLRNRMGLRIGARLYGQIGTVKGDFTCDRESFENGTDLGAGIICDAVSEDEVDQRYAGLELSASDTRGNWEFFVAGALNYLSAEFRVDALYHFSGNPEQIRSREVLQTSGWTWSGQGGVNYHLASGLTLGGAVFYTPLDVTRPPAEGPSGESLINLRALLSYQVGGRPSPDVRVIR